MTHISFRHTIRGRLLLLALGVEVLMLTILVFNSLRLQHGAMQNQSLGTLHFGLNLSQIVSARRMLLIQGISIAAVETILSSLILLLIGFWLTRHLTSLTKASLQVAAGNLTPPPVQEGSDDVGQLGIAFNIMSRAISERINELTAAKESAESANRAKSEFLANMSHEIDCLCDAGRQGKMPGG